MVESVHVRSPPPPPPLPPPVTTPPVPVGALILGDEFNGAAGAKPNSALWTARTGGSNGLAHYDGETMLALDGNGNLKVTCAKVNGVWQSGFISTIPHPYSGPRYMETRAKVAAGQGAWSAPLWEWHAPYGAGGIENDVCEQLGRQPDAYHATLHNWTTATAPQSGHTIAAVSALAGSFHVYGAAVYSDRIDYYLDGVKKATALASSVGLSNLTSYEMVAVIDLNIGGWGGTPAAGLTSISMLVDFVHVYTLGERRSWRAGAVCKAELSPRAE